MVRIKKKRNQYVVAVVDSDLSILDSVQMVLEEAGLQILIYPSGENFLSDLYHKAFDCLLLDPNLPGIDGADIVRQLMESNSRARILVFTARPYDEKALALKQSGIEKILIKPVSEQVLINAVREALESPAKQLH